MTNDNERQDSEKNFDGAIRRRDVLKVAGIGIGSTVVGSIPVSGATSSPFATGPTSRTWDAKSLDVGGLPEANPPSDPRIGDTKNSTGFQEVEEIARQTPDQVSQTGGPSGRQLDKNGATPITIGTNFEGLGTRDTVRDKDNPYFLVPSDAQLAVGTDHVLEAINAEIAIFDKGGEKFHHFRLEDWFENVLNLASGDVKPTQFRNIQVFDPRARYDATHDRYVVACVEFNLPDKVNGSPVDDPNDHTGAYLLSVSDSSDPTGNWTNYRIPPLQGTPPKAVQDERPTQGLVDFPELGIGPDAVYLTENFFKITSAGLRFTGATMEVLNKQDLLAGRNVSTLHFTGLQNADGSPAFTVQPANQTTGNTFHLMNVRFSHGDSVTVWSVTNPTSESNIAVTNDAVGVEPYNNPVAAKQPNTEDKIDTGDTRFVDAVAYDEGTGNLWAAHTINDASVRWYEIDPSGPSVVQQSTFKRNGIPTFYPVAATNGDSTMLVYNVSGPKNSDSTGKNYARIEVAGRTNDYTLGEMENYAIVKDGESMYDYINAGEGDPGSQTMRWGDYNGIQVDPEDNSYWVISQYANDPTTIQTFGTRIANMSFE